MGLGVKKTRIILGTCLLDDLGKTTLIISSNQPLICLAKALSNGSNGNDICCKLYSIVYKSDVNIVTATYFQIGSISVRI